MREHLIINKAPQVKWLTVWRFCIFTDQNKPIARRDLLHITSGIQQTIEGDHQAFDQGNPGDLTSIEVIAAYANADLRK